MGPNSSGHRRHLGRRLSILYRIEDDPKHPFSEVVGWLQRIDGEGTDEVLVLSKKDASVVKVSVSSIVRSKVIT